MCSPSKIMDPKENFCSSQWILNSYWERGGSIHCGTSSIPGVVEKAWQSHNSYVFSLLFLIFPVKRDIFNLIGEREYWQGMMSGLNIANWSSRLNKQRKGSVESGTRVSNFHFHFHFHFHYFFLNFLWPSIQYTILTFLLLLSWFENATKY